MSAVLYNNEVDPDNPGHWGDDATVEEIMHTINHVGHVSLYPDVFGLSPNSSRLSQAMDVARGGQWVTFPDDYPNSVKHFLMLGAVGMLIGAVVFLSLNMLRSKRSTVHSVTFILATVMAMSYYAMWTGLGVTFKTTDTSPRVIFWGRYLGHLIAMPLVLVDLSYACKLDVGAMLTLVCYDIIMYAAGFVGAYSVGASCAALLVLCYPSHTGLPAAGERTRGEGRGAIVRGEPGRARHAARRGADRVRDERPARDAGGGVPRRRAGHGRLRRDPRHPAAALAGLRCPDRRPDRLGDLGGPARHPCRRHGRPGRQAHRPPAPAR